MEKSGTTHHSEGREMITIPFLDQPLSQQSSDNKSCNSQDPYSIFDIPHREIPKYTVIQTIKQTIEVVTSVLLKEERLAIDCEGQKLSKEGRLTLIQVCIKLINNIFR